ncbi:MAG: glycosyltransferase family 4 protein [Clostridiales bacterium]|nr:glycosyltransferase family 4 protein [Clostridiales bacterium]
MDYLVDENEGSNEYEFVVYSIFDKAAKKKSKIYKNTKFVYIPINRNLNKINNFIIKVVRKIFKIELKTLLIREIIKYLRKENFDKIIVEGNEVQILQLRKYYKGKLYFHAHHDAFNTCKINPNKIIDSCEKVITVSEYIKERTLNVCSVKNYDKIIKVENCIDNKVFNKMLYIDEKIQLRNKYGIKDDELVIMFTGRIIKEKGIKELIEAFKLICTDKKVKLMIVGNAGFANETISSYDRELFELSKSISDKIIFTGFIHNLELPKIHSIVDIAVVPSIWEEPAGLVAIEALASGLPLIVTESGGLTEYVNEKCAIILKKDKNLIKNMAKALENLIDNEDLRKKMSFEARKQGEKYGTREYYNAYINALKG